jgi:transposase-like protein
MSSSLSALHLQNEEAAYAYVEARVWPEGPICPHCRKSGRIYAIAANAGTKVRIGLKKCGECRKQFTVKVGTVFESSHVPLHLWLQAMALITSSKKGISSNQLARVLGVTIKTAWFMSHRIRLAMADGSIEPFGSGGTAVEADETFIGIKPGAKVARGYGHKNAVLSIVDRETGRVRSRVIADVSQNTIMPILRESVSRKARLMTDEANQYRRYGVWNFAQHGTVNHSAGEYVSADDPDVHVNTVEGTFSVFKRGMRGIYQHCATKHLHRYLAEFDFRYSYRAARGVDDKARADRVLDGVIGKRLTYRTVSGRRPGAEERVVW